MAILSALSISRLVNVSANLANTKAVAQNLSAMLILGSSPIIDTFTRMRAYQNPQQVATDFGGAAPEYLAALAYFEQTPQPSGNLYIGRWAKTAVPATLIGAPMSAAQEATLLAALQSVTTGSLAITIDGASHALANLNFSAITTLNGAAAILQTALGGLIAVNWNAAYGYFQITSGSVGVTSAITFASNTGSGTDISGNIGLTGATSGAYVVQGMAAESALAATQLFDGNFGQLWYALMICGASDADHEVVAPYIEASSNFHFYGVSTQEAGCLVPSFTTDIAYILSRMNLTRTAVQFNSGSPYAIASLFGRILTVDYTANNSTISLMYKQEPGVTADVLNVTQINSLETKNANAFTAYSDGSAIIEPGVTSAGVPNYIDTTMIIAQLSVAVQAAVYAVLYGSTTKIPQTDAGMHILTTTIDNVMQQFVANGALAAGVWEGTSFGALNTGDTLDKGYYIYAPPVSSQSVTNRAQRISVPIQVACKLAGAVQTVNVAITLDN